MTFSSAGVYARNDTLVDPGMAVELTARGIASEDFRSRRLTPSLVDEADLVLTAEAAHRAAILDEHPIASRKVLTVGQADRALDRLDPSLGRAGARRPRWSRPGAGRPRTSTSSTRTGRVPRPPGPARRSWTWWWTGCSPG